MSVKIVNSKYSETTYGDLATGDTFEDPVHGTLYMKTYPVEYRGIHYNTVTLESGNMVRWSDEEKVVKVNIQITILRN